MKWENGGQYFPKTLKSMSQGFYIQSSSPSITEATEKEF